mmetsp:Transcript_20638/g.43778  ORF Transcript_20638/g.43778 Transcript_20638/m.43778 type:complete len:209 (+) Transcript_20638:511-1137(+)
MDTTESAAVLVQVSRPLANMVRCQDVNAVPHQVPGGAALFQVVPLPLGVSQECVQDSHGTGSGPQIGPEIPFPQERHGRSTSTSTIAFLLLLLLLYAIQENRVGRSQGQIASEGVVSEFSAEEPQGLETTGQTKQDRAVVAWWIVAVVVVVVASTTSLFVVQVREFVDNAMGNGGCFLFLSHSRQCGHQQATRSNKVVRQQTQMARRR